MATKGTGAIAKNSKGIKGKGEKEGNQRSLEFKGEINSSRKLDRKKVTFEGEEEIMKEERKEVRAEETRLEGIKRELKEYIAKEISELKKERKRYIEIEEEWRNKERNWEIRIRMLEEKTEEIGKDIKALKEELERDREMIDGDSDRSVSVRSSVRSSIKSKGMSGGANYMGGSIGSNLGSNISDDRLSMREVGKLRKWMIDREKEVRKNNIVLKGLNIDMIRKEMRDGSKEEWKEWLKKLLDKKLGIECKIEGSRLSGRVIVVTLKDEDMKREVMKNKSKLKGENIFIENDLTWEERKIQERINKWTKEMRSKGKDIKIAIGKVRIEGRWVFWEELEREIAMEEEKDKRKETEGRDKEKESGEDTEGMNFV